jgi:hypothetical protein
VLLYLKRYISVEEDTYAAVYATTPKGKKAIVSILGTDQIVVILMVKSESTIT